MTSFISPHLICKFLAATWLLVMLPVPALCAGSKTLKIAVDTHTRLPYIEGIRRAHRPSAHGQGGPTQMARCAERRELDRYISSREIMEAIERIAGDRFTDKDDTAAHKIWDSPSVGQAVKIFDTAWKLAGPDADILYWGAETYRRPVP